ncbi:hypothetical protein VNO77_03664 [Canavalia gladiata]|uniref:Uncharacterized protein n=1 Tax=Canavalia gladiata TaxID=3824 RepID=A0AAN9R8C5_CANGL
MATDLMEKSSLDRSVRLVCVCKPCKGKPLFRAFCFYSPSAMFYQEVCIYRGLLSLVRVRVLEWEVESEDPHGVTDSEGWGKDNTCL